MNVLLRSTIALSLCLLVNVNAAAQTQPLFYSPPQSPKLTESVSNFLLHTSDESETIKAWIFFTDKQILSEAGFQKALDDRHVQLSERALKRRAKMRSAGDLVDYKDLAVSHEYISQALSTGAKQRAISAWFNGISVAATAAQIRAIAALPFVKEIRPVMLSRRQEVTAPPDKTQINTNRAAFHQVLSRDYGASFAQLQQINVPALHELGLDGTGVLVAMLDTGFFKSHTAFSHANVIAERDFVFDDDDTQTDPNDPNDSSDSHGTLTWSTLGGLADGELYGPAFNASFILAKTEDTRSETPIEEDNYVEALEWVESLGADVVSSSLGYFLFDGGGGYTFADLDGNTAVTTIAADYAASLGVVIVTAAGNQRNNSTWPYLITPSDGDSVIAVGAVDANGNVASFSSPGPTADNRIKPDVAARGVSTYCASRPTPTSFGRASGTSLSTPLVGGVAAILLQIHPDWTPIQVRDALRNTASQSDQPDNDIGWGIIDAFRAADLGIPWLAIGEFAIDDDEVGASSGNGNGLVEPGEVLEISVAIKNVGDAAATNVAATLQSHSPFAVMLDSTEQVGNMQPAAETSIANGFVVAIDSAIIDPENITLALELQGDFAATWRAELNFTAAVFSLVAGVVTDAATSLPIPNATTLVFGPLDETATPDTAVLISTNQLGEFSQAMYPGRYAISASANGYLQSDAMLIDLPSDSVRLDLALAAPRLQTDRNAILTALGPGMQINETLTITNGGSGELFFTVMETARPTAFENATLVSPREPFNLRFEGVPPHQLPEAFSTPVANQTQDSSWQLLRLDPDDGIRFDLKSLSARQAEQNLYVKLTGHRNWGPPVDWVAGVFLDTDANPSTGTPIVPGVGADYAVAGGSLGDVLLISTGDDFQFIGLLSHVVYQNDSLEIGVSFAEVGIAPETNATVNMVAFMLQGNDPATLIQWDALPDENQLPYAQYAVSEIDWLDATPRWSTVAAGASQELSVFIDATQLDEGKFISVLSIASNQASSFLKLIPVQIDVSTAVDTRDTPALPTAFALEQSYPNPFTTGAPLHQNRFVQIKYQLPVNAEVKIEIYNLLGQRVRTLLNEKQVPGFHAVHWDGRDDVGKTAGSGVYFYRMAAGEFVAYRKLVVAR